MSAWRWILEEDINGDAIDPSFTGEKLGDEIILFKAIAPSLMIEATFRFSAMTMSASGDGSLKFHKSGANTPISPSTIPERTRRWTAMPRYQTSSA